MKIDKLHWVFNAMSQSLAEQGLFCGGFYFFDQWLDMTGWAVDDEDTLACLRKAYSGGDIYRASGSAVAWFFFPDLNFVLAVQFAKVPRAPTLVKHRKRLDEVSGAAVNGYMVAHNPLTGLLAKDAFAQALDQCVSYMSAPSSINADAQESSLPRAVAVMALDIDYFKQVNDTWGHYYGDQVLKAFGRRLEEVAAGIRDSSGGDVAVFVGHPSGEEFLVVISASATKERFVEWASLFRVKIADSFLPSETEWASLTRAAPAIVSPPPLQERSVTTSVGVTWHTSIPRSGNPSKFGAELLERADTALYRAKAAGRNQVIFYDEILATCGKVIEYDISTGVAALDIGKNVGVTVGQEFKVYPSSYTGTKKFTVNDGRTTRTLGFYPKVESGRLVVFNTQPEISFACVSPHDSGQSTFEVGASLEAIPAGSIRHLLPHFSRFFPVPDEAARSDGILPVQEYLSKTSESGKFPFAIVIRFSREAEYSKRYGPASLNYALAKLFKGAQATFHAAKFVEVLDRSSICIVGTERAFKEKMILDFSNDMADDLPELGVLAGIYCRADSESDSKTYKVDLDHENALDFARIAASELGREPDARIRHFGFRTAQTILQAHRDARSYKVAYADYQKFTSLGLHSSGLENLAGLISGNLGQYKTALDHYEAAIRISPDVLIYKSNYCTAAVRLDEFDLALGVMNQLSLADLDKLKDSHPYGYTCYVSALARAKNAGSKLFLKERFAKLASVAVTLEDALSETDEKIIKEAMAGI